MDYGGGLGQGRARLMVVGWCLITGALLILDALRLRARASSDADGDLA